MKSKHILILLSLKPPSSNSVTKILKNLQEKSGCLFLLGFHGITHVLLFVLYADYTQHDTICLSLLSLQCKLNIMGFVLNTHSEDYTFRDHVCGLLVSHLEL